MALGGSKENKPSKLVHARQRLDTALLRLEKAIEAKTPQADSVGMQSLAEEMAALRQENEKLSILNKTTGERLDSAIKRLKTTLENA